MKLIPRFSLRTLLLIVLLIASAATLWWNWSSWSPELTLRESGQIKSAHLLRDGSGVVLHVQSPPDEHGVIVNRIKFRELPSGATRYTLNAPDGYGLLFPSEGEKYIYYCVPKRSRMSNWPVSNVWRASDGFAIEPNAFLPLNGDLTIRFSEDDRFAYVRADFTEQRTLLKMPELTPIGPLAALYGEDKRPASLAPKAFFSSHGRWFVDYMSLDKVRIYDLAADCKSQDVDLASHLSADHKLGWVGFSPDERWFVFCRWRESGKNDYTGKTILIDTATWTEAAAYDAPVLNGTTPFTDDSQFIKFGQPPPLGGIWTAGYSTRQLRQYSGLETGYYTMAHTALLHGMSPLIASDAATGQELWALDLCGQRWMNSDDRDTDYGVLDDPDTQLLKRIFSLKTGRVVFNADDWRWRLQFGRIASGVRVTGKPSRFLTFPERETPSDAPSSFMIWHRSRPEEWWNVIYLPEFWLTLLLAAALLWSLFRDRKILKP